MSMETSTIEKLLSPDQVCEILGIKKSTLYYWTANEMIPFLKIWGVLRFRRNDIKKWLELKAHNNVISKKAFEIMNEIEKGN